MRASLDIYGCGDPSSPLSLWRCASPKTSCSGMAEHVLRAPVAVTRWVLTDRSVTRGIAGQTHPSGRSWTRRKRRLPAPLCIRTNLRESKQAWHRDKLSWLCLRICGPLIIEVDVRHELSSANHLDTNCEGEQQYKTR